MIARVLLVALQGVRTHRGRSALTAGSLFVGVLALVLIQAAGGAAEQSVMASSVLSSGGAVTVKVTVVPGPQAFERARRACTALGDAVGPTGGAAAFVSHGGVRVNGKPVEAAFVGGDLLGVFPFAVRDGRWLSPEPAMPAELVMNEAAASTFGLAPGASVRVSVADRTMTAHVVGVVFDGWAEPRCFMSLDTSSQWGLALSSSQAATIYVHVPGADADKLAKLVAVECARAFDTGPEMQVERSDPVDPEARVLATVTLIFSLVGGLSLIVGALAILNIGLATLKERSDELSLRRSFGATRSEVILTIVAEGQIVALAAAAVAMLAAWLVFPLAVTLLARGVLISDVSFPMGAALIGVAASCCAALVGSLAPAIRASRVPIASIMRI